MPKFGAVQKKSLIAKRPRDSEVDADEGFIFKNYTTNKFCLPKRVIAKD
jgi:hypothetical protein